MMLRQYLNDILNGRLRSVPQDDSEATYAPLIKKEDGRLYWQQMTIALDRHIRAMTPWPGAFTTWQGRHLKILAARPVNGKLPAGEPGQIISDGHTAIVLTKNGGLELLQVQLAGKRVMSMADFLRGQPDFMVSILGE
jgi:methionyl-tRNA formyltransferase